ncbi:MAG TPA: OsmC family protein [Afifellaceae bacterium]|nr:OsmC family protein [Afifellaceae bacterium]
MVTIKPKTTIGMKLSANAPTHSRTDVSVRDVSSIIDEPEARGGTNQGLTPTETLMASLMGCTNTISQRIAHHMGVKIGSFDIALTADFDRRGVMLEEDVERPFSNVVMDIDVTTDATPQQMEKLKADLQKFCPIAKVIRGGGVTITENWNVSGL